MLMSCGTRTGLSECCSHFDGTCAWNPLMARDIDADAVLAYETGIFCDIYYVWLDRSEY
jgi:hypothetical protein